MNPLFKKLLKQKKKRARDPNAPPPPTLLGQVKELRLTKEEQDRQSLEIVMLNQRLSYLEMKNRRLESQVSELMGVINRIR